MAGALGVVITTDVPMSGQHAQPVYVDDSLPIVGPSRACVVTTGEVPQMGGPPMAVRLAPAGTPAIGPGMYVYVVSGSLSSGPVVSPPVNTVLPAISGTLNLGQLLTTTDGTWTGTAPIVYTYQWKRGGVSIGSATNSTYITVLADVGTTLTVTVTATNAGGSTPATSTGAAIFNPATLAAIWCKADSLALANNDPVSSWTDSSGLAHHLVQATGILQPIYNTNQVSGLPAILFDGTLSFLQTGSFTLSHPCAVFLVVQQVSWTTGDRLHEGRSGSTLLLRQTGASPQVQMIGSSAGTVVAGPTIGAWGLITEVWNGASSSIAINGGANATFDMGAATSPNGITLAATNAGISLANIAVAEIIVCPSVLSGANEAAYKTYLNAKYLLF